MKRLFTCLLLSILALSGCKSKDSAQSDAQNNEPQNVLFADNPVPAECHQWIFEPCPKTCSSGCYITKEMIEAKTAQGFEESELDDTGIYILLRALDTDALHAMIAAGIDVNAKDLVEKTALFYVKSPKHAQALIDAGANVNHRSAGLLPTTPILDNKDVEILKILLKAGADSNAKDEFENTALFNAPNAEYVKILIEAGADPNARNHSGETPLFTKSLDLPPSAAQALIDAGADARAKDEYNATPLHTAKHPETAQILIKAGADVNAKDQFGNTPLHKAVIFSPKVTKILIHAGADVNARDKNGETPLIKAEDLESVELLLEAGADAKATDNEGNTALKHQDENIIKALIRAGADVKAKNKHGFTPLMQTLGHQEVSVLLAAGADPNATNDKGESPLMFVKDAESVRLLIKMGADPKLKSKEGNTALLHILDNASSFRMMESLTDGLADLKEAFENRDNPDAILKPKDKTKLTKLEMLVQDLIKAGVDVNAKDEFGKSALMMADSLNLVKMLVEAKADINAKDNDGKSVYQIHLNDYTHYKEIFEDDDPNKKAIVDFLKSKGAK